MTRALSALAGGAAIASGLAYLAYIVLPGQPEWAITAWNLLIIPAFLVLGIRLAPGGPLLAAGSAAVGVAASVLWAFDYGRPSVEPWWIGLAAASWLGIGWLLLSWRRATGWLTLILGAAAATDLVVTLMDAGLPLLALGGMKLPLTNVWCIWVGIVLIRAAQTDRDPLPLRLAAGPMAIAGGAVWIVGALGWLFTHGTQPNVNTAAILGLTGTEFTQLLIVATALWVVALAAEVPRLRAAEVAWLVSLIGVGMVGVGALFETSIVDPVADFRHPLVQSGWLLFIGGLFPVLFGGMLALAATSARGRAERSAYAAIGAAAPLPVVAFFVGGLNEGGIIGIAALAFMHAAPGIGWIGLGLARRRPAAKLVERAPSTVSA